MSGYVYIFDREDGLRKVGWTVDIERRLGNHKGATGLRHSVARQWEMGNVAARTVEGIVHSSLWHSRVAREVYDLPIAVLVAAVEDAMRKVADTIGLASSNEPELPTSEVIAEANDWLISHPEEYAAIMDGFAEFERAIAHERTMAGLQAAKARGKGPGRVSKFSDEEVLATQTLSIKEGAAKLGLTVQGYTKRLQRALENAAKGSQR